VGTAEARVRVAASRAVLEELGDEAFREAVNSTRPWANGELSRWGRAGELDAVLVDVAEKLFTRLVDFDPERGTLGAYAHGIARFVVRRAVATPTAMAGVGDGVDIAELVDRSGWHHTVGGREPVEPLAHFVRRFETARLLEYVSTEVSEKDWALIVDMAAGSSERSIPEIAAAHSMTVRAVRTARERIAVTAQTVRLAVAAVEAGRCLDEDAVDQCIPHTHGLAVVNDAASKGLPVPMIARQLGVSEVSVRVQMTRVQALRRIAMRVILSEGA
jgi:hypothetical protein